jgi:hypothetical protein
MPVAQIIAVPFRDLLPGAEFHNSDVDAEHMVLAKDKPTR